MRSDRMPTFFRENFERFSQLETDDERAQFWKELAANEICLQPAFKNDFNAALSMLSDRLSEIEIKAREKSIA